MAPNIFSNSNDLSPPPTNISVSQFFSGQDVFVTGGLGFMGKILVEKLLWSCENIGNLYLLVRPKKGYSASERIEELLKLPVFDRLKENKPTFLKKIIPIDGDILKTGLGISDYDRKILESRVSIIFHVASSVRFDDPLKKAVFINVRGTKYVIDLAKNMKNLKVLLYVSTTFCNVFQINSYEKVYLSNYDWRNLINIAENIDENVINVLSAKILDKHPNTYTFTKYHAENMIYEYSKDLPCVIFRPSIVTFALNEPVPGWIDSLNGPMGLITGVFSGVIHVLYGRLELQSDYIPCDFSINGIIVAAWYKGTCKTKECIVVNGANGGKNCMSFSYVCKNSDRFIKDIPPQKLVWYPFLIMTQNKYFYAFLNFFLHILPGTILDIFLRFTKIKIRLMPLYRKLYFTNMLMKFFMMIEWKFDTRNYDALQGFLNPEEREIFNYDMESVNQNHTILLGLQGTKKHILKEKTTTEALEAAKKLLSKMYWAHQIVKGCIYIIFLSIGWCMLKRFGVFKALEHFTTL